MTDLQLKALIDSVLSGSLAGYGYLGATVLSGQDHDGEAALFIDVAFGPSEAAWTGAAISMMKKTIWSALRQSGETRFPYVTFKPEDASAERQHKIVHDLLRA